MCQGVTVKKPSHRRPNGLDLKGEMGRGGGATGRWGGGNVRWGKGYGVYVHSH